MKRWFDLALPLAALILSIISLFTFIYVMWPVSRREDCFDRQYISSVHLLRGDQTLVNESDEFPTCAEPRPRLKRLFSIHDATSKLPWFSSFKPTLDFLSLHQIKGAPLRLLLREDRPYSVVWNSERLEVGTKLVEKNLLAGIFVRGLIRQKHPEVHPLVSAAIADLVVSLTPGSNLLTELSTKGVWPHYLLNNFDYCKGNLKLQEHENLCRTVIAKQEWVQEFSPPSLRAPLSLLLRRVYDQLSLREKHIFLTRLFDSPPNLPSYDASDLWELKAFFRKFLDSLFSEFAPEVLANRVLDEIVDQPERQSLVVFDYPTAFSPLSEWPNKSIEPRHIVWMTGVSDQELKRLGRPIQFKINKNGLRVENALWFACRAPRFGELSQYVKIASFVTFVEVCVDSQSPSAVEEVVRIVESIAGRKQWKEGIIPEKPQLAQIRFDLRAVEIALDRGLSDEFRLQWRLREIDPKAPPPRPKIQRWESELGLRAEHLQKKFVEKTEVWHFNGAVEVVDQAIPGPFRSLRLIK